MPTATTYPGVYIEEIPSGVRTITGVATSITAFIGSAARGPVNEPTIVNSFGDFERRFGGLSVESMMSYAVRDFFLNDGSQALIVRVHNGAPKAQIVLMTSGGSLTLEAANEGEWGGKLVASVDYATRDLGEVVRDDKLFNLTIAENFDGGARERYANVSVDPDDPRYLPRVLEESSALVKVPKSGGTWSIPSTRPLTTFVLESPPAGGQAKEVDHPVAASSGSDGNPIGSTQLIGDESQKE